MARQSRRRPAPRRNSVESAASQSTAGPAVEVTQGTTGRYLVLFDRGAVPQAASMMKRVAGLTVARSEDFGEGVVSPESIGGDEAVMLSSLGIALTNAPPEQTRALGVAADTGILAVEPERIVYTTADYPNPPMALSASPAIPVDYLRGYRDAVNELYDRLTGGEGPSEPAGVAAVDETEATWGLQATKVLASQYSGKGIGVAVLDTGVDADHPDFAGRAITTASFIQGQSVQDGHGHGTHCIGTSCGPKAPGTLPRYGIAYNADIFAGKVLSNGGSGGDAGILAGIQWAMTNKCSVVSMSLGAPTQVGQAFSQVFEHAARRALMQGTLIIAAAGNESRRPGLIAPVGHPANCPSIMAVGAVDRFLSVAPFSCGGLNPQGGQVDIAGPGVDVRSTWPRPTLYRTISGTSMATPHVAGIAALYAEADATFRGRVLMSMLTQYARRLSAPARDVGSGLVQAI